MQSALVFTILATIFIPHSIYATNIIIVIIYALGKKILEDENSVLNLVVLQGGNAVSAEFLGNLPSGLEDF